MVNWSPEPWHISGTAEEFTADLDLDVLGGPQWSEQRLARDAINLGTGTTTTITRQDTSGTWRVALPIIIQPEDNVTLRSDLDAIWRLLGPWTLTDAEGFEWDVVADVAGGGRTYSNEGPFRIMTIPFRVV